MDPNIPVGIFLGFIAWFLLRYLAGGIYTVDQNERAVKTNFGRAERIPGATTLTDPISASLDAEEKQRYQYPQVRVIMPGGPYFKWPWQKIYKVSIATQTVNMAFDPDAPGANQSGTIVEAVTKDQLNTGLTGQIRYHISERNLYANIFAVKRPISHVMGYFVSVLRERIATFEAPLLLAPPIPAAAASPSTISARICATSMNIWTMSAVRPKRATALCSTPRLITGIDPPPEVESALAAINTAHNMVSSDVSLAQATADQRIEQSKRAAEIETLKAQAEVQPLISLASQLSELKTTGEGALRAYVRNVRLGLFGSAQQVVMETKR